MKKAFSILAALSLAAFSLSGCGSSQAPQENTPADSGEETLKIGIVQIVEHPSLDTIRESFINSLEEQGYKDGENISIKWDQKKGDIIIFISAQIDLKLKLVRRDKETSLSQLRK